jgi:glycosidase
MKNAEWLRDAIIYHILVDRFSTGDSEKDKKLAGKTSKGWMGGNIRGIIKKVPYLKELGVNTIYLSPIYHSPYYHGYNVTNFFEINSHFGKKENLKKLVDVCHKNNIRVILDFVPNHLSCLHPFFVDAQKNKNSKYYDWFVFNKWPNDYMCFLDIKDIPKINLENRDAREHIISAAEYWVKEFDIDGYRLDHAIGPPKDFLEELKNRMKRLKSTFVLIGEVWLRGIKVSHMETLWFLRSFSKTDYEKIRQLLRKGNVVGANEMAIKRIAKANVLDGCLDFVFMECVWDLAENKLTLNGFQKRLRAYYSSFDKDFCLLTFLSNHDRGRFLFHAKNMKMFKMLSSFQFSLPKTPQIYYGDEIGLPQKGPIGFNIPFADIEARRFMIWDKKRQNRKLFEYFKKLCKSREKSEF